MPNIIVGPIIGLVTSTTARVLIEVDEPCDIACTASPVFSMSAQAHSPSSNSRHSRNVSIGSFTLSHIANSMNMDARLNDLEKQLDDFAIAPIDVAIRIPTSHRPVAFTIQDLQPGKNYLLNFEGIENAHERIGSLCTLPLNTTSSVSDKPIKMQFLVINGSETTQDACNYLHAAENLEPFPIVCMHVGGSISSSGAHDVFEHALDRLKTTLTKHSSEQLPASSSSSIINESSTSNNEYQTANEHEPPASNDENHEHEELSPLEQAMRAEEIVIMGLYRELYRSAFNEPNMKHILSSSSNYMNMCDFALDEKIILKSKNPSTLEHRIFKCAKRVYWEYSRQLWDNSINDLLDTTIDESVAQVIPCTRTGFILLDSFPLSVRESPAETLRHLLIEQTTFDNANILILVSSTPLFLPNAKVPIFRNSVASQSEEGDANHALPKSPKTGRKSDVELASILYQWKKMSQSRTIVLASTIAAPYGFASLSHLSVDHSQTALNQPLPSTSPQASCASSSSLATSSSDPSEEAVIPVRDINDIEEHVFSQIVSISNGASSSASTRRFSNLTLGATGAAAIASSAAAAAAGNLSARGSRSSSSNMQFAMELSPNTIAAASPFTLAPPPPPIAAAAAAINAVNAGGNRNSYQQSYFENLKQQVFPITSHPWHNNGNGLLQAPIPLQAPPVPLKSYNPQQQQQQFGYEFHYNFRYSHLTSVPMLTILHVKQIHDTSLVALRTFYNGKYVAHFLTSKSPVLVIPDRRAFLNVSNGGHARGSGGHRGSFTIVHDSPANSPRLNSPRMTTSPRSGTSPRLAQSMRKNSQLVDVTPYHISRVSPTTAEAALSRQALRNSFSSNNNISIQGAMSSSSSKANINNNSGEMVAAAANPSPLVANEKSAAALVTMSDEQREKRKSGLKTLFDAVTKGTFGVKKTSENAFLIEPVTPVASNGPNGSNNDKRSSLQLATLKLQELLKIPPKQTNNGPSNEYAPLPQQDNSPLNAKPYQRLSLKLDPDSALGNDSLLFQTPPPASNNSGLGNSAHNSSSSKLLARKSSSGSGNRRFSIKNALFGISDEPTSKSATNTPTKTPPLQFGVALNPSPASGNEANNHKGSPRIVSATPRSARGSLFGFSLGGNKNAENNDMPEPLSARNPSTQPIPISGTKKPRPKNIVKSFFGCFGL